MVLEKTLESPLDSKKIKLVNPKGNQSWIFIEGLMLKLKLQYFGHLIQIADSLEKNLMLGKIEGRRRGRQRMRRLGGITDSVDMSLANSGRWWWTGSSAVPGVAKGQTRLNYWKTTKLLWYGFSQDILMAPGRRKIIKLSFPDALSHHHLRLIFSQLVSILNQIHPSLADPCSLSL